MVSVRKAKKKDVKSINSLTLQMHNHLGQLVGISFSSHELKDELYDEIDSLDEVYVAEVEGEVVGYLSFTHKVFEDEWCGKHFKIDHLIVEKKHRRKGYGTKLLEVMLQKAQNDDANVVADTFVRNIGTGEFLERHGFKPLSTIFIFDRKRRLEL